MNATSVSPGEIQKNLFFHLDQDPCPQPKQLNATQLPRCEYLKGYDSFQGSEISYIYGITFFIFFPVFCVCAGYGLIKLTNSRRKRAKRNEPDANCFSNGKESKSSEEKICVREWMDPGRSRPVTVNFGCGESSDITLVDR
jgi:dual oxidase